MGGQSFKCPHCDRWVLTRRALRDHLKDAHQIACDEIEGTGPAVTLVGERFLHSTS